MFQSPTGSGKDIGSLGFPTGVRKKIEPWADLWFCRSPSLLRVKTSANRCSGGLLTPERELVNSSAEPRQDANLLHSRMDMLSILSSVEFRRQQTTGRGEVHTPNPHESSQNALGVSLLCGFPPSLSSIGFLFAPFGGEARGKIRGHP